MRSAKTMIKAFARERRDAIERALNGDWSALRRFDVHIRRERRLVHLYAPLHAGCVPSSHRHLRHLLENVTPLLPTRQLRAIESDNTHRVAARRRKLGRALGRSGKCIREDRWTAESTLRSSAARRVRYYDAIAIRTFAWELTSSRMRFKLANEHDTWIVNDAHTIAIVLRR